MPAAPTRVFVLGLDGLPYTLATRFAESGVMARLGRLMDQDQAVQIDSVYPTVSNVAWACFQTGKNPGKFGIFGFAEVDRQMRLRLPNGSDLRGETLEELAWRAGRRVISLGIPTAYPPRHINGLMVGGFLAPSLEKAVWPPERAAQLEALGYKLDIDPIRARQDPGYFRRELLEAFDGRRRTAEALLGEDWDLFILHVMETDRINHFLYGQWDGGQPEAARFFEDFYRRVDDLVGLVAGRLSPGDLLLILSDHGFCTIRAEVELNRWLMRQGLLRLAGDPGREMFAAVSDESIAFALVPGRVHILRRDAWDRGAVAPEDYERVRQDLMARLTALTDPATGQPVCRKVFRREEVFAGPYLDRAPDILIDPADGYDLKAALSDGEVFSRSPLTGMHTFSDALAFARGQPLSSQRRCITDATRSILDALGVQSPADLDSRGLLD
jgi:predicted AlkP superfamily phosphohydrolase/phosphomutase